MPTREEKRKLQKLDRLYEKALVSIESGQCEYAITLLENALSIDPNFVKAQEGIKLAKTRQLQQASLSIQKFRCISFMLQAFFYEHIKKYKKALDKYESLFVLIHPPLVILPHLGDMYMANEMIESATTTYKSVLHGDANNTHALRQLGKIYIDLGNMAAAKPVYDRLSSLPSIDRTVDKEVNDAYALITINKGRWEEEVSFRKKVKADGKTTGEAEAKGIQGKEEEEEPEMSLSEQTSMMRKSLEKDPHNINLRKELAKLLLEEKYVDEALSEYRKIANLDPKDVATHETLAQLYREQGNIAKAVKEYENLHNLFPDRLDILNTLAGLLHEQDAPEKAIEVYKKVIKFSTADVDAHMALGKLYEQTRYFDDAILEYEKVAALAPERKEVEERIGNLYLRGGKTEKAISSFEKAVENVPTNVGLRKILADLYLGENLSDKAKAAYQEILKITPDDSSVIAKLQEIEATQLDGKAQEIDKEIQEYERKSLEKPDNSEIRGNLETAKLAKLDLHIQALENRIKADPDNLKFHYQLGLIYKERGYFNRALKELQLSVNDIEMSVKSSHLIGLCFEEKNVLDIAARQLEKAAGSLSDVNDTKKSILYDLGRVYEKMHEDQKALDKYKEIYEVDISYKDISQKIEQSYK